MNSIAAVEGRGSEYIGSRESIDTAKAVMRMVQGKATKVDNALLRRSDGAVTLLTAIEGNDKAWNKVKEAAGRELVPQSEGEDSGVRYRISYTTKNEPVVVIEDDILDGVEKSGWVKTAKDAIKKFRPEIPISGRFVRVNKVTGAEYTNSKYTDHIRKTDETKYRDKLTAAGNLDEIVIASTRYVSEGLNHSRKDNFSDFARGNVLLQVGGRKYSAEVIIGMKSNGDAVLYDVVNINGKNFDVKKKTNPNPDTSDNRVTRREDSSPTDRIPQKEESVNTHSMQDGEVYSQGREVSFPEKARVVKGIVLNDESLTFRRRNPKGYKNVEMLAQDLGMRVMYVKGLTDSAGTSLDGVITSQGIFINSEAKNPSRFVATHEFSHRMKQASPEAWQRYQDFVVNRLKIDGRYYAVFEAKAKAYGNSDESYINEEIAADYIGELFENETELAELIKESRRDAITIRDMWYKVLDRLGMLDEKKKAQLMWRDSYREAVLNVKEGQVESKGEPRYSIREEAISEIEKAISNKNYDKEIKLTDSSPAILTSQKGVKNLPMMMIASHIRENILTEQEAKDLGLKVNENINYHGLGKPLFIKVINDLDKVNQAYRGTKNAEDSDRRENYFLLISQHEDAKGNTINIPVYINQKGVYNKIFIDTNKIATVFGRDELNAYIKKQIAAGNLVRIKNRSTQASESQSPINSDYSKNASTDTNVPQDTLVVNTHSMQNGENDAKKIEGNIGSPWGLEKGSSPSTTARHTADVPSSTSLPQSIEKINKKSISDTRLSELEDTTSSDTDGGFIPPGAEPRREVKVHKSVKEGTKVRQFARTVAEAETLSDETAEGVLEDVEKGRFNYTPISDRSAMNNAYASLDAMGIEWVEKKVRDAIGSHSLDKNSVAMAEVILNVI